MRSVSIDDKLYGDIKDYCDINNLRMREYVETLIRKSFMVDKYGATPFAKETHNIEPEPAVKEEPKKEILKKEIPTTTIEPQAKVEETPKEIIAEKPKEEIPIVENKPQRRVKKLN